MPADQETLFPDLKGARTQLLIGGGPLWRPIRRPKMATMLQILLFGAGEGGGGGGGGGNHGSGKGGNSGGFASLIIAAALLPEIMHLRLPGGGAPGAGHNGYPGSAGTVPPIPILSVAPGSTAAADIVLSAALTVQTHADNMWAAYGAARWVACVAGGQAGANGSIAPGSSTPVAGLWITGGGGGCNVYGSATSSGQITGLGPIPTLLSGGNTSTPGRDGLWLPKLLAGSGGSGGGFASPGGKGGNGAPACGGGGGGNGSAGTGGDGGWGGPALCHLSWW